MANIEVTTTVRITNVTGMNSTQINKIVQGIKQCHSFPIDVKKNTEHKPGRKKLTVEVKS